MRNDLRLNFLTRRQMISILLLFMAFFVLDIYFEQALGTTRSELIIDLILESPRLILFMTLFFTIWKALSPNVALRPITTKQQTDQAGCAALWQETLNQDFAQWGFTKSEAEVAQELLLGKSLKEIAAKRFTSEKTIRNQCRNIYAKSSTAGRHELAAHFLKKSWP